MPLPQNINWQVVTGVCSFQGRFLSSSQMLPLDCTHNDRTEISTVGSRRLFYAHPVFRVCPQKTDPKKQAFVL
jgi:hypothetical protein